MTPLKLNAILLVVSTLLFYGLGAVYGVVWVDDAWGNCYFPLQKEGEYQFWSKGEKNANISTNTSDLSSCATAVALAQETQPAAAAAPQENPLSAHTRMRYGALKKILLRSAEKMPEENYSFKPTNAVRSFGQIVGHIADSRYASCSAVLSEKNSAPKVEKTKTSKVDLIAALTDAFAYCDRAYDGMSDAAAVETVKFGGDTPKLGVLTINTVHTTEHYGNLVTYMRMKDIVPPTSEPEFMKQLSQQMHKK